METEINIDFEENHPYQERKLREHDKGKVSYIFKNPLN